MKKLVAILFAALIIGVTPAIAAEYSEITADPMAVKGKGADTGVDASQILEENINSTTVENNTESAITSDTENTTNDDPAPAGDQAIYADAQVPDLNGTIIPENITVPQKDTTGIVMQTTDYSCGPAALATVLQNMGFNVTEHELKVLAGTDVSGTTMYGLAQAARSKGLNASGMRLSIGELRPNMIVHVIKDGTPHYSVVREVTNESVKLADPSLGNIEMTREKFSEIYTGNALVINVPQEVNQTAEQANNTDISSVQSQNSQTLTTEEMEIISGRGGVTKVVRRWWGRIVYLSSAVVHSIVNGMDAAALILALLKVPVKVAVAIGLSARLLSQINVHNTGIRVGVLWSGHIIWILPQRR